MIRDYQALQYTWFKKGKQRVIKTTGKHQGVKLLATLNYVTGQILWQEDISYNAEAFLTFLHYVMIAHQAGKVSCDRIRQCRIHHAKLIQPFLEQHATRLEFVFLPPYSPEFNIVEGLWKWMKADVINNVFYHNVKEIRSNVKVFMDHIMQDLFKVINRLCIKV